MLAIVITSLYESDLTSIRAISSILLPTLILMIVIMFMYFLKIM